MPVLLKSQDRDSTASLTFSLALTLQLPHSVLEGLNSASLSYLFGNDGVLSFAACGAPFEFIFILDEKVSEHHDC